MGYLTDYEVSVSGFADEEAMDIFEFKEFLKKDAPLADLMQSASIFHGHLSIFFNLYGVKWYNHFEDLSKMSRRWTELLIEVEGDGENPDDKWKARFRNGESEVVRAVITFPDFERIK